jgi:hypothetical protein
VGGAFTLAHPTKADMVPANPMGKTSWDSFGSVGVAQMIASAFLICAMALPPSFSFHNPEMNLDALHFVLAGMRSYENRRVLLSVYDGFLVTQTWNIENAGGNGKFDFKHDEPMAVKGWIAAIPFADRVFDVVFYPITTHRSRMAQWHLLGEIYPTLNTHGLLLFDAGTLDEWPKILHRIGFIRIPFKFKSWSIYMRREREVKIKWNKAMESAA